MKTFPDTALQLIEELEATYPQRSRGLTEDARAHDQYAGKAHLVSRLRERYEASLTQDRGMPKVL